MQLTNVSCAGVSAGQPGECPGQMTVDSYPGLATSPWSLVSGQPSLVMTASTLVTSLMASLSLVSGQAPAPAVLYLPLGGSGAAECQPAAGAKLTQLVPLM